MLRRSVACVDVLLLDMVLWRIYKLKWNYGHEGEPDLAEEHHCFYEATKFQTSIINTAKWSPLSEVDLRSSCKTTR